MSSEHDTAALSATDLVGTEQAEQHAVLVVRCLRADDPVRFVDEPPVVRHLRAEGWTVAFASAGDQMTDKYESEPGLLDRLREKWHFVETMVRLIPHYDVVHVISGTQQSTVRLAFPTLVLARFFGKKSILHFELADSEEFLEKWGRFCRPFLKLADSVVVGSRYLQKAVKRAHLRAAAITAPVDTSGITHSVKERLQPRIVLISPLETAYNVPCALKAFGLVKQKYPRAELIIVGNGSQAEQLQEQIEEERLFGVELAGDLSSEEMRTLIAGADIYLNSSSIDESPPVLAIAFAAGLPVVTTDADGLLHLVRDRVNALVAPVNDHVGLANRIIELVDKPDLCRRLSLQGRREAVKQSWQRVRQDWVNLYCRTAAARD
ncbi:MAG: glycosyltransferase family 4 protein [candidate division Zixibacteria bacterium]|nr:glycosyltransferase family 4 protein [candidate division Zixibacteria bacterium]